MTVRSEVPLTVGGAVQPPSVVVRQVLEGVNDGLVVNVKEGRVGTNDGAEPVGSCCWSGSESLTVTFIMIESSVSALTSSLL